MSYQKRAMLVDVRQGDVLSLDRIVNVELVHKSGHFARLRVTAPDNVLIEKKSNGPIHSRTKDDKVTPS